MLISYTFNIFNYHSYSFSVIYFTFSSSFFYSAERIAPFCEQAFSNSSLNARKCSFEVNLAQNFYPLASLSEISYPTQVQALLLVFNSSSLHSISSFFCSKWLITHLCVFYARTKILTSPVF